ncbi:hypothetical protein EPO44_15485 [bacterium]|nr:MAG: hypothetical protein EPO44_15485 [bacterium]
MFELICNQIHEHLRESQRKRDQLAAFYIALLAGIFAGWDALAPQRASALAGAVLIGLVFLLILLHYRRWHIKYNNALTLFQHIAANKRDANLVECEQLWGLLNDRRNGRVLVDPREGVEAATYLGFAFVVGFVFHLFIDEANLGFTAPVGGELLVLATNVSVVVAVALVAAIWFLPSSQTFVGNDWMFRWLREVPPPAPSQSAEEHG